MGQADTLDNPPGYRGCRGRAGTTDLLEKTALLETTSEVEIVLKSAHRA